MIASSSASARVNERETRPSKRTTIRSAMPSTSGSSDEIISTATPSAARSESSRCTSAFVATSIPRVGSSTISTAGLRASHFASTTFCWLPPDSVHTGFASRPYLQLQPQRPVGREAPLGAGRDQAEPLHAPERGERRRCARSRSPSRAPAAGGPRARARRPRPSRPSASRGRSRRPSISTAPASQRSMPKIARATSLRPAPTRPASATISPLADVERDVGEDALARQPVDLEHDAARAPSRTFGKSAPISRPTIARMIDCVVSSSIGCVSTWRPSRITVTRWQSAKTSSSRCEMKSTAAPRARSVSAIPNSRSTSVVVSAAVGSSITITRAFARQRLRDLDELLVGDREPAREPVGIDAHAELLEERGRVAAHLAPVDPVPALQRLRADEDVLGDAEVGEERRLLEDDRDPRLLRLLGAVEDHLLAVEQQPAARRAGGRRRGS